MIKNTKYLITAFRPFKPYLILFQHKQCFSNLPKPSRFAQQIGLHKQFENLQKESVKSEKSTVLTYQMVIWACISIIGSFLASLLINPTFRSKIALTFELALLSLGNRNRCLHSLGMLLDHQQKYYPNRSFSDTVSSKLISKCLSLQNASPQASQKYNQLLVKVLKNNIFNRKNIQNNFDLYHQYLGAIYETNQIKCDESQDMKQIVKYLVEMADLRTLYLVVLLNGKAVRLSDQDRKECLRRAAQFKEEIRAKEQKIKQIKELNKYMLTQPYEFECMMQSKWVKFIQKKI